MQVEFVSTIAVFTFGAIIGSFLNVVIFRLRTGRTMVSGRSRCLSCGKELAWWELVPVVSFLILKGRCSSCRSGISLQYPIVEVLTAALFTLSFLAATPLASSAAVTALLVVWAHIALFVVIAVYDYRHHIIPGTPLFLSVAVSLLGIVLAADVHGVDGLAWAVLGRLVAGLLLSVPFYLLWRWSHGRWIGLGDGKLAFAMGVMLGARDGLSAILLSFYVAAAWSLSLMLAGRLGRSKNPLLTMKSEVPFGPFLVAGALAVALFRLGAVALAPFVPLLALPL